MAITIDLTSEEQAAVEAQATARGMELSEFAKQGLLRAMLQEAKLQAEAAPTKPMTPREILAYWAEDTAPSVYGRTGEDAVTIARRLRRQAEQRGPVKS